MMSSVSLFEISTPRNAATISLLVYPRTSRALCASESFELPAGTEVRALDDASDVEMLSPYTLETLSFNSRITRAAVLAPMPFALAIAFEYSDRQTQ